MSFPITCTACHKTFTISDEIYEKKVAGRVVTIKCKSCSHGIRVDGTKGEARPSSAPAAATSELAAPTEPLWAVDYPDGQDREFTTAEVVAELERGVVNGQTLVWRDGMGEWLELAQVPELATELSTIEARKKAEADAKAKVEAQAKAKADAEAKAKADAEAKAKAPVSPLHKPRAPMPTVTGIGETPTPGAAKARAPLGGATDIKPRAPLGSGPDIKARVPLGSSPELKPRAPLGSAPEITPRAPLGGATDTKPRAPLGSGPDIKPRASLGSSPELKPRAPLGSGPDIKPRAPLGSSPEIKPRDSFESSPEVTPRVPFEVTPRAQQPSSPELLKPRVPQAPPTPLAKPTAPPPVMAAPAPVAPQPAPVAPPAFAASAFLSSPALETVTPPLPASVAKVVSKPPEIPTASAPPAFPMSTSPAPAFGTLPAVVADHASVEWPQSKKKTPLIVLGLVAAAVVIGGVVFALGGKDDVPPPSTPISATPTTPPTATPTAASPATATPTADAAPPSAQSGADTASGSDPIAATPGAGFAELFAAGARKAESKGATVASAARFDPAVTKAPLAQAATEAQACKQSGGPTGKVTVVVTFEPSGKAAGATITDAPFAGTATASCIAATMKRASIPPFSGLPGTVSKTFSLL